MIRALRNNWHLIEAVGANIQRSFPSRGMTVIGVTGTDGKTTTTTLIYHILKIAGKKVAAITTVGAIINNKTYDVGFHVTTPSSFELQKYIKRAKNAGCEYLVLEVTSHAIDQNRAFGIHPKISVLTNVTHEHLDYHGTFKDYLDTKIKFVRSADIMIVNKDDKSYEYFNSKLPGLDKRSGAGKTQNSKLQLKDKKLITYGLGKDSDINPVNFVFKTKLFGEFNLYNCLAAAAVCQQLGIPDEKIKKALASFEPPVGRQQIVFDKNFKVMIDFAHTPNAFEKLLPDLKKETVGRLIHVFGSAGRRDVSKRPMMGEVSSKYADIIILTAEDPRDEDPGSICKQIASGISNFKFLISNEIQNTKYKIPNTKYLIEEPERQEAIRLAISLAKRGDTVVITGKGHEKSMNYGKGEEDWDEFEAVSKAVKNLKS